MDEPVRCVLEVELSARGSDVALVVEIGLDVAMLCREEGVSSDVKLPIFVQKRLFNVFLDDVRTFLAINVSIFA